MKRMPAPYVVSKRLGTFERKTHRGEINTVQGFIVRFWHFDDYQFFIFKDPDMNDWTVCERSTGMAIVCGTHDRNLTLRVAFMRLIEQRGKFRDNVAANQMPKQRKGK